MKLAQMTIVLVLMFGLMTTAFAEQSGQAKAGGVFSLRAAGDELNDVSELESPFVTGLSARFKWQDIEPEPGQYNWRPLERAHEISTAKNKMLIIRVTAGMHSPNWIYRLGVPQIDFEADDASWMESGAKGRMPVPWNEVYLEMWEKFLEELGKKVQDWPNIFCVEMTGGGLIGEMQLPGKSETTIAQWKEAEISDEKVVSMWKRIITSYNKAMPQGVGVVLDLGMPFPKSEAPATLVEWAMQEFPARVWFQQNGLKEQYPADSVWSRMIRQASSITTVGYQMLGGGKFLDQQTGDRKKAFLRAIEDHCSYVEVYRADLLDPKWREEIEFLAKELDKSRGQHSVSSP
jgi:hypothetical protein